MSGSVYRGGPRPGRSGPARAFGQPLVLDPDDPRPLSCRANPHTPADVPVMLAFGGGLSLGRLSGAKQREQARGYTGEPRNRFLSFGAVRKSIKYLGGLKRYEREKASVTLYR